MDGDDSRPLCEACGGVGAEAGDADDADPATFEGEFEPDKVIRSDGGREDGWTKVAEVDEIPTGRGLGIDVKGIEIAVFNADGEFYAISNRCAHQQAPLCKAGTEKINSDHTWTKTRGRVDAEERTVTCPWHLWEWDLETGEHVVSGKRIGTFDVEVEGEDVLVRI